MNNYFDFYQIPLSFSIDTAELKRAFLRNSRQYHPDFYTQASPEIQEQTLQLATLNNKAYVVLANDDLRMHYILTLKGEISEAEHYELPPDFLMQMMDINENAMELAAHPNHKQLAALHTELNTISNHLKKEVEIPLAQYTDSPENAFLLKKIKEFYYKMRYLLRIQRNLSKFAPQL